MVQFVPLRPLSLGVFIPLNPRTTKWRTIPIRVNVRSHSQRWFLASSRLGIALHPLLGYGSCFVLPPLLPSHVVLINVVGNSLWLSAQIGHKSLARICFRQYSLSYGVGNCYFSIVLQVIEIINVVFSSFSNDLSLVFICFPLWLTEWKKHPVTWQIRRFTTSNGCLRGSFS